jgi:predicted GH43/DUF377 family glycosyl hydrolase
VHLSQYSINKIPYYGAADEHTALATVDVDELVAALR